MVNLICIAQEGKCKGALEPAGKGQGKNYTIFYFACSKCNAQHYLPTFEGVELKLEDYQDSLMLDDPMDGRIDRGN